MYSLWHTTLAALPFDWAQYAFMRDALIAVLLIAPLFALLGSMVIGNQMAFFSDAIGHATLAGLAIGLLARCADPVVPMVACSIVLALLVCLFRRYSAASTDTVIGIMMALGVALGICLLSRRGGMDQYARYLIGDILTVTKAELVRMALVLVCVVALWTAYFNRLLLIWLHRPVATSRGIHAWAHETAFTIVVAVSVTMSISWIGLLVINSMLILPAAAARNMARSTHGYTTWAVLIGMACGVAGLISSFYTQTATGATIVLYAITLFLLSLMFRR